MELVRMVNGREDKVVVATGSRGRPRPLETIRRDESILNLVGDKPRSRNDLWSELTAGGDSVSTSQVWLSLDRLRKRGLVRRCTTKSGQQVWTADVGAPCP